ncbi:MAG TPA: hypothetical protein VH108_11375 [Gaiellaceae bacterium]|nr:hypothetical protein [Gaiellaceae bacterium]
MSLPEGTVSAAVTKTCETGIMLGGGASLSGTNAAIQASNPIQGGWSASAVGTGPGDAPAQTLTVYVVCSGP